MMSVLLIMGDVLKSVTTLMAAFSATVTMGIALMMMVHLAMVSITTMIMIH